MPQSFAPVYIHLVFSTLKRRPFLGDSELRNETHRYLGGTSNALGCQSIIVGGVDDHVHILAGLGRTVSIADWVKELKRSSSPWVKSKGVTDFAWQSGYGAFSVSFDALPSVRQYIETQDEHHRKTTFQDEFLALLTAHDQQWDDRYIWD